MEFKIKNIKEKRNTGSICIHKTEENILNLLKDTFSINIENIKFDNKNKYCVLYELLLYLYDINSKNDKIWYLNPIQSILNNIERINI